MNLGLHYAHEKFGSAVDHMATSDAPLRQRLLEARTKIGPVMEDDLPDDAREPYRAFYARLTWAEPKGNERTINATMAVISDAEVRRLARLVADIHVSIVYAVIRDAEQCAARRASAEEQEQ